LEGKGVVLVTHMDESSPPPKSSTLWSRRTVHVQQMRLFLDWDEKAQAFFWRGREVFAVAGESFFSSAFGGEVGWMPR